MTEDLKQGDLLEMFHIDFIGGRMFWKKPPIYHPRLLGREAGGARSSRGNKLYWVVKIGGSAFKRGRLIFLSSYGRWPTPCIDHINGDSLDDRLVNLREATISENNMNHKTRTKTNDLPMGVRFENGRYRSRITFRGKQTTIGVFDSSEEAHAHYLAKRREIFGEFA